MALRRAALGLTAVAFALAACAPAPAPAPAPSPVPSPSPSPSPSVAPNVVPGVLKFEGLAEWKLNPLQGASLKAYDLATGRELAIVAGGAGNIVAGGAGNIVAGGAGNIVAGGAGNIVAGGAGNIVAGGAGNIVAGGAGNHRVLAQADGAASAEGLASGPPVTVAGGAFSYYLVGLRPDQTVKLVASAPGVNLVGLLGGSGFSLGGRIVAGGAGNIVAGGAGNIVAGGAGNIVAGGAGNIVAGGAGNIVAGGAGNLVAGAAVGPRRTLAQAEGGASVPEPGPSPAPVFLTVNLKLNAGSTIAAKSFEGAVKVQYRLPDELVALGLERAMALANEALGRLEEELQGNADLAEDLAGLVDETGELDDPNAFNQRLAQSALHDELQGLVQSSLTRFVQDLQNPEVGPARREESAVLSGEDFPINAVRISAQGTLSFTDRDGQVFEANLGPVITAPSPTEGPELPSPPPEPEGPGPALGQGKVGVRDGRLVNPTASEGLVR